LNSADVLLLNCRLNPHAAQAPEIDVPVSRKIDDKIRHKHDCRRGYAFVSAIVLVLAACSHEPRPAAAPTASAAPAAQLAPQGSSVQDQNTGDRSAHPAAPAQPVTSPVSAATPAPAQITHVAAGFDLAAYRADPAAYCRVVDGSRYLQVVDPGPDVPVVTAIGAGTATLRPGERVRVQVQTDPGTPVSCTSQGLGEFPASGQSAITVPADAQGVATIEFLASAGTVGHCLLIAGSPVRAGQVQFLITIREH